MEETGQNSTQEFCLRWNNFHSSLISALDGFKNDEDFVDVTLACEGQFLKAHKMLLSACSVFFRDLLKANPCQHPIVILPPEVRFGDLEKLLRFIYQGEVNVQQEHLARFLKTAEMLKIRGLAEDSEKQRVLRCTSPRPPEMGESDNISPKRPRLSIDVQQQSSQDSHTPNDDSRLSADSDSEMIPVKQEMVELKECSESLYEGDGDSFIPETYLREGNNCNSTLNNQSSSSSSLPAAPLPPGPLQPSYVPPPQTKTQDDSPLALTSSDDLSQGFEFLRAYDYNSGSHGDIGLMANNSYIEDSPYGVISNGLPWRRPLSGTDGYVSCPQCQKPITSYNLNRHIRMVHSNMDHAVCTICNKEFKNKYSLATHIHRQHSDLSIGDQRQEVNNLADVTQLACRSALETLSSCKGNDNEKIAVHQIKNQSVNDLNFIGESHLRKQVVNNPYSPKKN